jgi:hypothetical protein
MKKSICTLALATGLLALPLMALGANTSDPNELEPCINGAVSYTGQFASQALEDAHKSSVAQAKQSPQR